mgnify:CR=1 FL=1
MQKYNFFCKYQNFFVYFKFIFKKTAKDNKIRKLLDFTDNPHDVLDPWYTGEFSLTFNEINQGVKDLINYLGKYKKEPY